MERKKTIAIISGSIRTGRVSHRVALFFQKFITENNMADVALLDLKALNFPLSEERLKYLPQPSNEILFFSSEIKRADAVIVVSPEYNSGYPASVKNAIDLLYDEWYRKPIGIVSVSDGNFGGMHALQMLQTVFLKVKASLVPATFPVPLVHANYDENGNPTDKERTEKRAKLFLAEIMKSIQSNELLK
ncbi:MAG TPA: NAD(P)H-dependent oxidoreductase [Bacteroidia bacterium]|nr:NAD(P)H-dependent oxidoreductase [Bacteroidia bacterium]